MTTIHTYLDAGDKIVDASVSCSIEPGIGLHLVGVSDVAVKEILLRSVTAMQCEGFTVPGKKIVIRIESETKRFVPETLDLPVALAIIAENEGLVVRDGIRAAGELALNGEVRKSAPVYCTLLNFHKKSRTHDVLIGAGSLKRAVAQLRHLSKQH